MPAPRRCDRRRPRSRGDREGTCGDPFGLRCTSSRRLRAGNDATVAGEPTSCSAAGKADPGVGARGGWPKLENDNPQEPRPGGRRANPPAPGRLGPWGSSAPRGTPVAFPSLARESLVLRPEGRLNLTVATAGGATHRPAVRRPDPSALLAGAPTRISRSNRVGPSGQLSAIGAHEATVKATFPLARRICPAQDGRITSIVLARLRDDPQTRAYAARRRSEGKSAREVRRCLKRVVARQLFKLLERYDRSEVEVLKAS